MIISHKYRCIFIKTAKTAGSSVEVFLSKAGGPSDVVTTLTPPEKSHALRNFRGLFNPLPELLSSRGLSWRKTFENFRTRAKFWSHLPAKFVRARVGSEIWDSYYKFCIERNPWDKTLSHYHMINTMRGGGLDFDAYLAKGKFCWNAPIYLDWDDETCLVDRVLHYERLDEDLGEVFEKLGIPYSGTLRERSKAGLRPDRRHYREVFSSSQAKVIEKAFAKEISLHNYVY